LAGKKGTSGYRLAALLIGEPDISTEVV
jgi:hypothetical protein